MYDQSGKYRVFLFTCFFPPYFLFDLLFFSCHCSLFLSPFLSPSLHQSLLDSLPLCSSSEPTPRQQCGPGGSNQLNYWEHKNAAANGSWINTLAKLLPRLPLLPQGIKLKILRLRMQWLGAIAVALSWTEPQLWHTRAIQKLLGYSELTW